MKKGSIIGLIIIILLIVLLIYFYYPSSEPMVENCAKAGEISMNDVTGEYLECCSGLDVVSMFPDGTPEECVEFANMIGWGNICTDCGNAICEEWENKCVCPEDCR